MKIFTINRTFNAPRDVVWECWTNSDHFANWFSPAGCTTVVFHSDIRPRGHIHLKIAMPDGNHLFGKYTFKEINPMERIIYLSEFADENGNQVRHPFESNWPLTLETTVEFRTVEIKTEIHLTWVPLGATELEIETFERALDSCKIGWTGTFDNLQNYLPTCSI